MKSVLFAVLIVTAMTTVNVAHAQKVTPALHNCILKNVKEAIGKAAIIVAASTDPLAEKKTGVVIANNATTAIEVCIASTR